MTRIKENAEKDMRSQINKYLTLGERTFKLLKKRSLAKFILSVEEKKQEYLGWPVDEE